MSHIILFSRNARFYYFFSKSKVSAKIPKKILFGNEINPLLYKGKMGVNFQIKATFYGSNNFSGKSREFCRNTTH